MTGTKMRRDLLFMRNNYQKDGKWDIPLVKKQSININNIDLIACYDTRNNDVDENRSRGVHFFVDDYRFAGIYNHPEKTLKKFSQYSFLLTPDFSTYADMPMWRQLENVARNRWVGAYWQEHGLIVIPTVSWSTPMSFDFCFNGTETHSIVAVSTVGCRKERYNFMCGYNTMLKLIKPETVICFGEPFDEMEGHIIFVDYRSSRKAVR